MKFWKRWITDIRDATRHASLAQRGAYDALLDEYYASEAPLPEDAQQLYRIAHAFDAAERNAVDAVVKQFFTLGEDGRLHNRRADRYLAEELPRMQTWHDRAKAGAAARWAKPDPTTGEVKKINGSAHVGAGDGIVIESIPLKDGTEYEVRQTYADELARLYPDVDVPATLKEIRGWNIANDAKRKTRVGIKAHINEWCRRDQNGP